MEYKDVFWQRLLGVLLCPTETFEYFERKKDILTPIFFTILNIFLVSILSGEAAFVVSGVMVSVISLFLISSIIFLIIKKLKGNGKYLQYVSVVGYSTAVVNTFAFFTSLIAFLFSGRFNFDSKATSIVNFLPPDLEGTFVYGFLRQVEIFWIWIIILIIIGISKVSKLNKNLVLAVVVVLALIVMVFNGANEVVSNGSL